MNTSNKTLLQILVEELPKRGGWPEGTSRISQGAVTVCIYADGHRVLFRHNVYGGDDCVTRDQYEAALAASKAVVGHEGWIQWAGGDCPVDSDAIVEVKFRDPNRCKFNSLIAGDFDWSHDGSNGDIIAYRLQQPHEVKTAGIDVQRDAVKSNDAQLEADLNDCIGQANQADEEAAAILYDIATIAIDEVLHIDIATSKTLAIHLARAGYRKQ